MESQYSSQIVSIISSFEEQQSQHDLLNAITKAQSTCIPEQEVTEIKLMMDKVSVYNTKLLSIKATMSMLTGRSKQLQTKADNLKTTKIQYLSQIDKIRKMEQEKDQTIAAVIPSESSSSLLESPAAVSVSSPKVKSIVKRKKTRAREALIGDDKSTGNWLPKKVSSQKEFF
ncbi:hypothetical protein HPULCUR_008933 [Helicostylum pulchrum]|uniref:Uncharacterized protein n=1 Tax=Helicostylum pulchrum TaxID=562976 RepID=A0ABP9Y913_9FUNG